MPPLPDSLGVAAPFAGVCDGVLLVAGGANFPKGMPWEGGRKVWHDRVWALAAPDKSWREVGKLPRPLGYGVSATFSNNVFCVGGSDSDWHHAEVFRITLAGERPSITPLPPLPIPLAMHAGALVDGHLFIVGGAEQPGEKAASARAFALNLRAPNAAWRELPPLPGPARILANAAALDGVLYVFGGVALEKQTSGEVRRVYLRDAWSYRESNGWKRLADLPKPLAAAPGPAPVVDGEILLLTGDDGSKLGFQPVEKHPGWPRTILAYDVKRNAWRATDDAPFARATATGVEWNHRFVVISGEVRPGVRSPEVWSLIRR